MKQYEKPLIYENEEMSEGVYATNSGNAGDNTGTESSTTKCKSKYMNGVYQVGTYNPHTDGYKVGRGCEGCPASYGSKCAVETVNYSGDFRPSWEQNGHLPDEKGY